MTVPTDVTVGDGSAVSACRDRGGRRLSPPEPRPGPDQDEIARRADRENRAGAAPAASGRPGRQPARATRTGWSTSCRSAWCRDDFFVRFVSIFQELAATSAGGRRQPRAPPRSDRHPDADDQRAGRLDRRGGGRCVASREHRSARCWPGRAGRWRTAAPRAVSGSTWRCSPMGGHVVDGGGIWAEGEAPADVGLGAHGGVGAPAICRRTSSSGWCVIRCRRMSAPNC